MKIILHPLFIVTVVIGAVAVSGWFMLAIVAAVLVHEFSHVWAARAFGITAREIRLLPFGAEVNIDCTFLGTREKALILLSGSFGNIAAALITSCLLWLAPELFMVFEYFMVANAIPAILNLLPIYPLDGGKILCLLTDSAKTQRIIKILSNIAAITLLVVGCIISFNFPLILFGAVMLLGINLDMKKSQFTSCLLKPVKVNKHRVRDVAVTADMTLLGVYKLVSPRNYARFIITDRNNHTFYENDLEKWLTVHPPTKKLGELSPRIFVP